MMLLVRLIVSVPIYVLITATFGFWAIYLCKRMKECYKYMMDNKREIMYGEEFNRIIYIQLKDVYKSSAIKYGLLLLITLAEGFGMSTMLMYFDFPNGELLLEYYDKEQLKFNICEGSNISNWSYVKLANYQYYPITNTLLILSNASFLISSAIGIGLMKLTAAQYKFTNSWDIVKRSVIRILTISSIYCAITLLLSLISYTRVISNALLSFIFPIYILLFFKNVKCLRRAIEQYSRERLIQMGENRNELLQLKRFRILSFMLCIQFLVGSILVTFEEIKFLVYLFLYFGKCYFPLVYGITYHPILTNAHQLLILFRIDYYLIRIQTGLAVFLALLIGVPFTVVTGMIVCGLFYRRFMRRIRVPIRYRYGTMN